MSSKIIYFLKDNDIINKNGDDEIENNFENSLVKINEKKNNFSAFSGGGRSLKKEVKEEEEVKEELKKEEYEYKFDENKPSTPIQFRFYDGTRLVQKFNLSDTISSLYSFVQLQKPIISNDDDQSGNEKKYEKFDLMKSHPRMILNQKDQTIEQVGLKGGGVIQIKE